MAISGNLRQFSAITSDFWYLHVLCVNFWEKIKNIEVNISIQYKGMDEDKFEKKFCEKELPKHRAFAKIVNFAKIWGLPSVALCRAH